jgi:hypothetical protein
LRKQGIKNPASERTSGFFFARCKPQDRGQIAPQHDRQLVLFGYERYESPPQAASLAQLGSRILGRVLLAQEPNGKGNGLGSRGGHQ